MGGMKGDVRYNQYAPTEDGTIRKRKTAYVRPTVGGATNGCGDLVNGICLKCRANYYRHKKCLDCKRRNAVEETGFRFCDGCKNRTTSLPCPNSTKKNHWSKCTRNIKRGCGDTAPSASKTRARS